MGGNRGRLVSAAVRQQAMELISQACQSGARKGQACEILGLSLRTLERWEKAHGFEDKRKLKAHSPKNKLTQAQRKKVMMTVNSEIYRDLPPCKIVPLLADAGEYIASESTFYRILREEKQMTHRQMSRSASHHRPTPYEASGANQVWTWDISYLPTQVVGLYFYLYMIIDIFSRKIVGFSVHSEESALHASHLITQACLDEGISQEHLVLHSDNGSPMKGATMLATLEKLGIVPSFSRPSVSDDNPYSEALFRTVKYHPTFPILDKFPTILSARQWSEKFVHWYNNLHLHSALKFVTPQQRHTGEDKCIRACRHEVYQMAKAHYPERWSGQTRNWSLPESVSLNPNRKNKPDKITAHGDSLAQGLLATIKLREQECLKGTGESSRQTANAVRQNGCSQFM